jgi:predicted nucleic-acid-binding protein
MGFSGKRLCFLDTNILARFILKDDESSKTKIKEIFDLGVQDKAEYFVSVQVIVELNYVLIHHYNIPRDKIILAIEKILGLGFINLISTFQNFNSVLEVYSKNLKLSLEDCIYLETCKEQGLELITLDKNLKKEFEK